MIRPVIFAMRFGRRIGGASVSHPLKKQFVRLNDLGVVAGFHLDGLRAVGRFSVGVDGNAHTRALPGTASNGHMMSVSGVCSRRVCARGQGSRNQARHAESLFLRNPSPDHHGLSESSNSFHNHSPLGKKDPARGPSATSEAVSASPFSCFETCNERSFLCALCESAFGQRETV